MNKMIGRADRLEVKKAMDHWKAKGLDFSNILYQPEVPTDVGRFCQIAQDHGLEKALDNTVLRKLCAPAIERKEKVLAMLPIRNVHRVVGTIVGSEITRRWGAEGLPEDTIEIHFTGSAGQSFGAFMPRGMTFFLEGDSNDYVGKGLSGGKIIVYPPAQSTFVPGGEHHHRQRGLLRRDGRRGLHPRHGGRALLRPQQRRQRGGVESVGDHGCEYMTGGRVVVLGAPGAISPPACPAAWPTCWTRPANSRPLQPADGRARKAGGRG